MKFTHPLFPVLLSALAMALQVTAGDKRPLDDGWQFSLDGSDAWETVDLPHDWSVTFDFDSIYPSGNDGGYVRAGRGHYRKHLSLDPEDMKRVHNLYLEGVYMNSTVVVNGDTIGHRPYGYSSMIYDITPAVRQGDNLIEVLVDNSAQKNCRWYSGSGIYRHVWLLSAHPTHLRPWSVAITTPEVNASQAEVLVTGTVDNPGTTTSATVGIYRDGKLVATESGQVGKDGSFSIPLQVTDPALWSPEQPNLYTAEISVAENGNVTDTSTETFGIREFRYSATDGLTLNGRNIVLNGGCVHHDNGLLGARSYDDAEARKVRLLKEAGFNAVRTSHNPPSPAFLDECDRQGLIVIDEIFDGWRDSKTEHDYARDFDRWSDKDVSAMVLRDRNHPSIMSWSIGNEVIERKKIEIITTARKLAGICRKLDPTRPVTQALCSWDSDWEIYDPLAEQLDITGYNYMIHKSETDHQRDPQRVMWQTESYPRDAFSNWLKVKNNPYIIGDFVWTAIDYLGESGIGRYYYKGQSEGEHYERNQWPWHGAYCGDIDITGWRKPISYYRQALYDENPSLHLAVREPNGYYGEIKETQWSVYPTWDSWTWPGMEEKEIDVEIVSRHPSVILYVNGNEVGRADMSEANGYRAVMPVKYHPGELKVVAVGTDGKPTGNEAVINTAGKVKKMRLTADRSEMDADNQSLIYVTAELIDADGNVVPVDDREIEFRISGPGTIIAAGSADLTDKVKYTTPRHSSWKGRAMAVVKSSGKPGRITLSAHATDLPTARVSLRSR